MFLSEDWKFFLKEELDTNKFDKLISFVQNEYKNKIIYPKYDEIFRAFNLLTPKSIKTVIIGQDPYHGDGQANGLAFSVSPLKKIPPSLKNIYKELVSDIGCNEPMNGDLTKWAKQGVLLINAVLTVQESQANSHKDIGWENFTDSVIEKLSLEYKNIVFILWGASSQKKSPLIDENKHLILKSPHPSPLSAYRGFFKSKPFTKSNKYLKEHNIKEIDWCLISQGTLL